MAAESYCLLVKHAILSASVSKWVIIIHTNRWSCARTFAGYTSEVDWPRTLSSYIAYLSITALTLLNVQGYFSYKLCYCASVYKVITNILRGETVSKLRWRQECESYEFAQVS